MLRSLTVKNFAVIDELTLEFGPGLNVLTGETGAGKSILIEALGFLLGARGNPSWLRSGSPRLEVTGIFDKEDFSPELRSQFRIVSSPVPIRRELDLNGRTRALLNAQSVPLSALAAWGDGLVDFHGQHEHQALLKPSVQRESLDRFGGLSELAGETASAYARWDSLRAERESLTLSDAERLRRVDLYRHQVQEISETHCRPGEDEELEADLPTLKNADRIKTYSQTAYELLYEAEGSISADLMKLERTLSELDRLDPLFHESLSAVAGARLSLEEVTRVLSSARERSALSPGRLDEMLSRLEEIARLKKKYGASIADVLAFRDRTAVELAALENHADRAGKVEAELAESEKVLAAACEKLHRARLKAARRLDLACLKELKVLGMPSAEFRIAVEMEESRFSSSGSDAVEFLLAPNPGEPAKPVRAIASGGELSRVMLAFKTVLAQADTAGILVFDEVDAGVGGVVARAVGSRLAGVARSRQILCVTHLAQVASFGRGHVHVSKEILSGRTRVRAKTLDASQRLETIATMLGGQEATAASRRHAQELLDSSRGEASPRPARSPSPVS